MNTSQKIELYIPTGSDQKGQLSIQGRIRIDGQFQGSIYCESQLEIGPQGIFIGDADVQSVIIWGHFSGTLCVQTEAYIKESASFSGLLDAQTLELQKGCQFKGEIQVRGTLT